MQAVFSAYSFARSLGEISPKNRMETVKSAPETAAPNSSLPTISPNTTAPTEESAIQTTVLVISMDDNVSSNRSCSLRAILAPNFFSSLIMSIRLRFAAE